MIARRTSMQVPTRAFTPKRLITAPTVWLRPKLTAAKSHNTYVSAHVLFGSGNGYGSSPLHIPHVQLYVDRGALWTINHLCCRLLPTHIIQSTNHDVYPVISWSLTQRSFAFMGLQPSTFGPSNLPFWLAISMKFELMRRQHFGTPWPNTATNK